MLMNMSNINDTLISDGYSIQSLVITFRSLRIPMNLNFYCVNTPYLVDKCIGLACCWSRQMLDKNVLTWALTGSVLFIRQVACQPPARLLCVCMHAYFLLLFGMKMSGSSLF